MKKTISHYEITKEIKEKYGDIYNNTNEYFNVYISILTRENIFNIDLIEHKDIASDYKESINDIIHMNEKRPGSSGVKNYCMKFYSELKKLNKAIKYNNKQSYTDMSAYLLCKIESPVIVFGESYFFKLLNGDLDKELNLTKTIIIYKAIDEADLPKTSVDNSIVYYKRLYTHQRPELLYREIRKAKDIFDNLKTEIYENSKM
ncbi:hypothetical protein [Buttiauxella gaviniae]|uniref:hypothetical protein n=1 Tax=Buttiauxella gaviniae TaxID=82990 RepID=UPI0039B0B2B1